MKYVIGVDFGTLSARALLVEADSGREVSDFVSYYSHGVLEEKLPCGKKLQRGFALQVPRDYVSSLSESVRGAVSCAGIDVGDVIGLCIDFITFHIISQ